MIASPGSRASREERGAGSGAAAAGTDSPILAVRDLRTRFHTDEGTARAVDGVSFEIEAGRVLALVGESGCGKSVTALSILRLLPEPPAEIAGGEVLWRGRDLLRLPARAMRAIRGKEISIVFQEPMTSLNPVLRTGDQVAEAILAHERVGRRVARRRAEELLERVGIPDARRRYDDYPHQMSGGMKQRVMIAMALACGPSLLIADEPTTALDVTIQAQILELLATLAEASGLAVLLITHNLGVVAELADEVAVMYAGKIVERASVEELFREPLHPYTVGLFRSLPRALGHGGEAAAPRGRLEAIPGIVPSPTEWPSGCRFRTRCSLATGECATDEPELREVEPGHRVACIKV